MLSFYLSAWTSQKSLQKCPPGPSPGPGGGKSTQNGPKIRKEGLKTVPRAVHAIFQVPLFRPERPPQADLAPKTPQRAPEAHLGPPGGRNLTPGGRNLTPGASFFGPPGVDFSTPCEPLSHAGGAILCLLCSRHLARRNARSDQINYL